MNTERYQSWRKNAALLSVIVGIGVMLGKFYAFRLTASQALLSDALESVVNVVGASFAWWAVQAAEEPPDENHPYGHGKIEFVTAVFEGGLISFAAIVIAYEALHALFTHSTTPNLESGLWIVVLAGALNGALAFVLFFVGKRTHSAALMADGKHVFADFLTTVGVVLGLGIVKLTGFVWLDPVIALVMAGLLAYTGIPLVRGAINGLIDAAEPDLLERIRLSLEKNRRPGFIRVHHVRAMRNGRRVHLDGHLVLPEFWSIHDAHDRSEDFEAQIVKDIFLEGEIEFHIDPCRRMYCKICDLDSCPIRAENFESRPPLEYSELVSPYDITDRRS